MQSNTKRFKYKLYSAALLLILTAAVVISFAFGGSSTVASADNGSLIDYTAPVVNTINLDVNGTIGTRESYNGDEKNIPYRYRDIDIEKILGGTSYRVSYPSGTNFSSVVHNYSNDFFTLAPGNQSGSSSGAYLQSIRITAIKSTSMLKGTSQGKGLPRFALDVYSSVEEPHYKTVYVAVNISADVPKVTTSDNMAYPISVKELYVGAALDASREEVLKPGDNGYNDDSQFPIVLKNGSTNKIDLEKYLVGRKLFFTDPGNETHTPESEGVYTSSGNEFILTGKVGVLKDNEKYVTFNDISGFHINAAETRISSIINNTNGIKYYDATEENRRSFLINVNIDSKTVGRYHDVEQPFWQAEGKYWPLRVELKLVDTTVVIILPVVFVPNDDPMPRSKFLMSTELNAGTDAYQINSSQTNVEGFNSVLVTPDVLFDFPTLENIKMRFSESEFPEGYNSNIVEITWQDADVTNQIAEGFRVKAKANGSTDVTFTVLYTTGKEIAKVVVPFTVYGGGYNSQKININGTRTREFNINSPVFSSARADGYRIVGAVGSGDTSCATVNFDGRGTITVAPLKTLPSGGTIDVTLVNKEGRRIVVTYGLVINLKGGDFFEGWQTWEIVLFWVGIGIAFALLVLLIVWLFVRASHRRKLDELETSAPMSTYIIKLNSTIAAAQAQKEQQKAMAQQQLAAATAGVQPPQPGSMFQLNIGAVNNNTGAPVDPNTLALGVTPQTSTSAPSYSTSAPMQSSPSASYAAPSNTTVNNTAVNEEIYIPISDEELLNRIYEERFEPRGMLRRTFDKSKDLQQRELEKEKERIRQDVRSGMSIEEACKSIKQREAEAAISLATASAPADSEPVVTVDPLIALLGFDPTEPIISEVKPDEIPENALPETKKLLEAEYNSRRLHNELEIIQGRIDAINSGVTKTEAELNDANFVAESVAANIKEAEQKLDDKNTDLAVEKRKAIKEALNKEIAELEAKIRSDKEISAVKKSEIDSFNNLLARLQALSNDYAGKKEATEALVATGDSELEMAREEARKAAELAEKARRQAQLNAQLEILNPMLLTVNGINDEIAAIEESIENNAQVKEARKSRVATLKNELMSTTDAAAINDLSAQIKELNKEISELDREATANTTLKSDKGIELKSLFRKINDYIEKEQIEVEDIIKAEDQIIGQLALDKLKKQVETDKANAEQNIAHWQNECDTLEANLDSLVVDAASDVAERVKVAEKELADVQIKLMELEAAMEATEDEDEKLNLSMEQMNLNEEIQKLTENVENLKAAGIKENLEFRNMSEQELATARDELARATTDFERATERYHEVSTNVNPLDLITSGSGIISKERKRIEAENLKKLVKEQQSAIEQARLAAQIAQQEAEKAVADAQRASEESKAESERLAQEALERAEAARLEAEQNAQEQIERMRLEAEEAKRLAEEDKERTRQEAEAEAERVRQEAEEAKRLAEEDKERTRQEAEAEAERARQEAEAETERVRQEAEETKRLAEEEAERARQEAEAEAERIRQENEEAKRLAEEEAERARKEAEEEAERVRLEEEETKRKAEEEAEKARLEAEAEAKRIAEEEAARKAKIDEKIAKRKAEIATIREQLKTIEDEAQGVALREKFYAMQLALDEDEKSTNELTDLLNKAMDDASHAAELARYKKLANQKPRRIVKKVTERVNRIPKKKQGAGGSRGARPGARPARPGARPAPRAGARPGAARPNVRPGARPTRPGARPTRPGARPTGARRPAGARPTNRK